MPKALSHAVARRRSFLLQATAASLESVHHISLFYHCSKRTISSQNHHTDKIDGRAIAFCKKLDALHLEAKKDKYMMQKKPELREMIETGLINHYVEISSSYKHSKYAILNLVNLGYTIDKTKVTRKSQVPKAIITIGHSVLQSAALRKTEEGQESRKTVSE